MNKFALIALVLVGCSDEGLSPEMIDCNVMTVDGKTKATKCSPICLGFDVRTATIGGMCKSATFAGSSTPSACNFFATYLKDENGNDHYGCCASGWAGADDFFPGANVPAGELHFYECDRSEWPEQKP